MTDEKTPQQKYEEKRIAKRISFNLEKEIDLIEFTNEVDFSKWVKEKIRHELELRKLKK